MQDERQQSLGFGTEDVVISSVTLNLLRILEQHLSLCARLEAIASDIIQGLGQLAEYYISSVFTWVTDDTESATQIAIFHDERTCTCVQHGGISTLRHRRRAEHAFAKLVLDV